MLQVIGDGAITGGMAYEAMNHAGFLDTNMIVILNDNQQVCGRIWHAAGKGPSGLLFTCLSGGVMQSTSTLVRTATRVAQVSLPTQYNGKNQEPVGALSSALAKLQVGLMLFWYSTRQSCSPWCSRAA